MAPSFRWILSCMLIFVATLDVACPDELLELICTDAAQCQMYQQYPSVKAVCESGHCHCTDEAGKPIPCTPKVHNKNNIIGGPCPCSQPNADCNKEQNVCYCADQYEPTADRRRCIAKEVPLGERCESDEQCRASGNYHAACQMAAVKSCVCMEGFLRMDNGTSKCLAVVGGNWSICTEDRQCEKFGVHARCAVDLQQCYCQAGFVSALNSTDCLEVLHYGSNCTEDLPCQSALGLGSVCTAGACACDSGYFPLEARDPTEDSVLTTCARFLTLGHYCRNNTDCYQHHLSESEQSLQCVFGECNCKRGYTANDNGQCTVSTAAVVPMANRFLLLAVATFLGAAPMS